MSDSFLMLASTLALIAVVPLTIYLFFLWLWSRNAPKLMSGVQETLILLLGLSGFLLLSGPLFISTIDSTTRWYLSSDMSQLRDLPRLQARNWSIMAAGYLILLATFIIGCFMARLHHSVILNTRLNDVFAAIDRAFEQHGYTTMRQGNLLAIQRMPAENPLKIPSQVVAEIKDFRFFHQVTIRWAAGLAPQRANLEQFIQAYLKERDYPSGTRASYWFGTALSCSAMVVLMLLTMIVMVTFFPRS